MKFIFKIFASGKEKRFNIPCWHDDIVIMATDTYIQVLPSKTGRFPVSIDTFSEKIQMVFQFSWVAVFYAKVRNCCSL